MIFLGPGAWAKTIKTLLCLQLCFRSTTNIAMNRNRWWQFENLVFACKFEITTTVHCGLWKTKFQRLPLNIVLSIESLLNVNFWNVKTERQWHTKQKLTDRKVNFSEMPRFHIKDLGILRLLAVQRWNWKLQRGMIVFGSSDKCLHSF